MSEHTRGEKLDGFVETMVPVHKPDVFICEMLNIVH